MELFGIGRLRLRARRRRRQRRLATKRQPNTAYNSNDSYDRDGAADPTLAPWRTRVNNENDSQNFAYSGGGSYLVGWSEPIGYGVSGTLTGVGSGTVTESGSDDWGYGYSTQASCASDGTWNPATGSGTMTETNANLWNYSANGSYNRPSSQGTLYGVWQGNGGSSSGFTMTSPSTLNPDGSWTTTGTAVSSGGAGGAWSYSGSGSFSSSASYGDAGNGGDSSFVNRRGDRDVFPRLVIAICS